MLTKQPSKLSQPFVDVNSATKPDSLTPARGKPLRKDVFGDPSWLTENLGEDNPLPWQRYYDPNIADPNKKGSLAASLLGRDQNYYNAANNIGLEDTEQQLTQPQLTGNYSSPMADAIARKSQTDMSSKLQGIRTANQANAPMQYSQGQGRAAKVINAAQENRNKNFQEQYDFQMKRYDLKRQHDAMVREEKDAFLGNVLGIAMKGMSFGMGG